MKSYEIVSEVPDMWPFTKSRKRQHLEDRVAAKEHQIQEIKEGTMEKLDRAGKSANKLHKLLKANGITLNIYIASGGARRMK